ncbi:hypothetical protein HNQ51_000074 [Inhella inkyongensis]|uniref:DUF2029 domain-containing protein n=1 Tax=Inhella inkyongensis TaxID=392593 RepID=A0A840S272_9BURK|nr:glycosyltransferase 87 family protein [Inhella inkyongensis]MBB5202781.1 hypothetical protein [Inhella inkyongensis]
MKQAILIEAIIFAIVAAIVAAIGVYFGLGGQGWSWDALNHHIYLGYIAESPRWHLDVAPASLQTYQYPYLYWPIYKLSILNISGLAVGMLWAGSQALLLALPAWALAYQLTIRTGSEWIDLGWRWAAGIIAMTSGLLWASIETSANDLLAAIPLLWALVLMAKDEVGNRRHFWAALLLGVAAAFKLSNAVFLPLLAFWCLTAGRVGTLKRGVFLLLGAALGAFAAYMPWGVQLYRVTGNPFHPFFANWF